MITRPGLVRELLTGKGFCAVLAATLDVVLDQFIAPRMAQARRPDDAEIFTRTAGRWIVGQICLFAQHDEFAQRSSSLPLMLEALWAATSPGMG